MMSVRMSADLHALVPIKDSLTEVQLTRVPKYGVYFLVEGCEVVYIGKSFSPLSRIGAHMHDDQKTFSRAFVLTPPLHALFRNVDDNDTDRKNFLLEKVEGAFISAMNPYYNRRMPAEPNEGYYEELLSSVYQCAKAQKPEGE